MATAFNHVSQLRAPVQDVVEWDTVTPVVVIPITRPVWSWALPTEIQLLKVYLYAEFSTANRKNKKGLGIQKRGGGGGGGCN